MYVSFPTETLPSIKTVESFFPLKCGIKFSKIALFALIISSGVPVSFPIISNHFVSNKIFFIQ